jgi:ribonucleotide reductase alpha subunit
MNVRLRILNRKIHETIYFGCLQSSCELAKKYGAYETFKGSPFSEGKLQYHLWGLNENDMLMKHDWKTLIEDIKQYGVRNSLLTAMMPTASTSQILGNNECIEPFTTNLYTRSTLAGEYTIINSYLVEDLIKKKLWNKEIRDELKFFGGSVQMIDKIPEDIKLLYRTAFELPQRSLIQLSIDRGPFVDQSQSLNLFFGEPDYDRLTSAHFYGWENGLKTGLYYLRTKPVTNAIMFGLDPDVIERIKRKYKLDDNNPTIDIESNDHTESPESSEYSEDDKISEFLSRFSHLSPPTTTPIEVCESCSG